MKKIVIFASGNGSNAQRIVEYFRENKQIEVEAIFTNNPKAGVIEKAKNLNVRCRIFTKEDLYENEQIKKELKQIEPDLIVLAGFLWKFPKQIIEEFEKKIINIHPALLPKYGGKGMYGMNVHRAVRENGERQSGITIHYVNEKYDQGAIISQHKVDITQQDTEEDIAQKIHQLEYRYFPEVIEKLLLWKNIK